MSEHSSSHHVPGESGVEYQEAGEEFLGEFGERDTDDSGFSGEFGERSHEGRENVSREASEEGPMI